MESLKAVKLSGDVEADDEAVGTDEADIYIDFSSPAAGAGGQTLPYIEACIRALRLKGTYVLIGGITGKFGISYRVVIFESLVLRGEVDV